MDKWTRPTRMVNGSPGVYTMDRSPLEIAVACVMLTAVIGFGGWTTITQIQLGRELSTMSSDVRSIRSEIAMRVETGEKVHAELKQADIDAANDRDLIVELLHQMQLRSAMYAEESQTNQEQGLRLLKKLPPPKEKRR